MEYLALQMIGLNLTFLIKRQFVPINGFNFSHAMPKGSVLGPILYLIYINDLKHVIKYCNVHHFADDTNFLHFNS